MHKLTQCEQSVLYTNCNSHLFSDLCTANCKPWAARDCAHLVKLIRSPQSIRGNSKKAIPSETLTQSLVLLQQYAKLPELITKIEGDKVSIVTCLQIISDFILELQSDDPIQTYLVNRFENMRDLMDIISCTTGLSPEKTAKLRGAVGSSASIERSFSKLGKLLAKDRNFNAKNVEAYICVYCNNR